ncbi:MAG: PHP domain-containing protein [Treponema sp.]|jgi:predicted metal-dependent phosphoesterase TrpH|nr:PHP domain-containing protein [Treponema sp.]
MKADLHLHSTWSDGSLSIPRLVRLAKALGLDAVSITDHDTMAGQEEALEE